MAKRPKKSRKSETNLQELVVVTFAEDLEQAKEYETLLETNGIPATIRKQAPPLRGAGQGEESAGAKSIAIMVPEDYLDEAHVVIESQNAYDDFYDFALEDEDEGDFDSELFEDDF